MPELSLAETLALAPPEEREAFLRSLTEAEARELDWSWEFNARPKQMWPESDWTTWALIAGRGFGKTWTGAHATRHVAESGETEILHLIAPTPADYRDVMIEGPAGLQSIAPKWRRPTFYPSKRLVVWPNGARALCFSAEDPEALRGPQCGWIWADEPGAWTYGQETWDMAQFGLRLGERPRQVMTTTPKPYKWLREILADPFTHVTTGTTYENLHNLAEPFKRAVIGKYEGTRLGKQELLAELLDAVEGALWTPELLERQRRYAMSADRPRVLVGVDPNASSKPTSDTAGIITVAVDEREHGYVIEDNSVPRAKPEEWARAAIAAYHRHRADAIVAEVNNGGEMVEHTIRVYDPNVNVEVVHASRGKAIRAQPVVGLFEQGRAFLLGTFPELEEQLTTWVPDGKQASPDRLDAMVWAFTAGMIDGPRARLIA